MLGIMNAYLDDGDVGSLVRLDDCDLLDGDISRLETGIHEVVRLEFAQSLLVEFGLELLKHKSKF